MSRLVDTVRVVRWAAETGARDYASIFTWRTWLAGWYLRVLAQVVFFALIGRLLGSEEAVFYLLVGNAIMLAAMTGIWSLNMVGWERYSGTLPLLVASPSSPVVVFASRGSYMIVDGLLSSMAALAVAGPLFGLPLPWPRVLLVLPLTAVIGLAAYSFGTFLGGLILRFREANNVVAVGTMLALMTVAGVNVPVDFYPDPVQWIAAVVPLTNGLHAIRDVLEGEAGATIAAGALREALVWLGWLALGLLTFNRLATKGRVDGSIEFGA